MITTNHYRLVLSSCVYDLTNALMKHDEGADMKVTNDKILEVSRHIYETALAFKGQEEGQRGVNG